MDQTEIAPKKTTRTTVRKQKQPKMWAHRSDNSGHLNQSAFSMEPQVSLLLFPKRGVGLLLCVEKAGVPGHTLEYTMREAMDLL